MKALHLLGTGAGRIHPQRAASSYLIETDVGDILMDAGEPVSATLAKRAYDWSRLAGIILTHTHADHTGGLPMLLQQLHISGRTNTLSLHGPHEFVSRLRDYLGLHYLILEAMKFDVQSKALTPGEAFEIAGVQFTPAPTSHLEPAREKVVQFAYPNRCEAFALSIRAGTTHGFYSGDVGAFDDVRNEIGSASVAILDSTHVDVDEIVDWASGHPGCQVVLSHVAPGFDAGRVLDRARSAGAVNVRLAADGEVVKL